MMWRLVVVLLLLAACEDGAPLPITLTVTPLQTALLPPGQPAVFLAQIDFRHDAPMQSIRLYVSGAFLDTIDIENRLWAANLRREVTVPVPLAAIAGPIQVELGARVGDAQLRSERVTLQVGDVERPHVTLSTPPVEATPGVPFILGFSASDNSGVIALEAVFGGAWSGRIPLVPDGRSQVHEAIQVTVPTGPRPGGEVTLSVVARDVTGNADTARATILLVDRTPPTVTLEMVDGRVMSYAPLAPRFWAYLAGETMTARLRTTDFVGLSHVVLHNPVVGRVDTIMLSGLENDTTLAVLGAVTASAQAWLTAELHDLGGNVRLDSVPAGAFVARVPQTEILGTAAPFPVFTPGGSRFVTGLSTIRVFALDPLRVIHTVTISPGVWGLDLTPAGDSIVAASAAAGGIVRGPLYGSAGDFTTLSVPAGDLPYYVALDSTGTLGVTAQRDALGTTARLTVSLASGAAHELEVGGSDQRVVRPPDRGYLLFGTGIVAGGGARASTTALPDGDISFDATGSRVLVGDMLFDPSWTGTDLVPGETSHVSALSLDGLTAWIGFRNRPEVMVVRTEDAVVLDRLLLPFLPIAFTLSPNGDVLVVEGGGQVAVVDVR